MIVNMIPLQLLNELCKEIVSYHSNKELASQGVADLIKAIDTKEAYWHVENKTLWPIKDWRLSQSNLEKRRELLAGIKQRIEDRKEALKELTKGVMAMLGADKDMAQSLALVILHKRNNPAALVFGVDISNVPELDGKHLIYDERGEYYEL